MTRHLGWDFGALLIMARIVDQKTYKTLCGKRVSINRVGYPTAKLEGRNMRADCAECRDSLARYIRDTRKILREDRSQ